MQTNETVGYLKDCPHSHTTASTSCTYRLSLGTIPLTPELGVEHQGTLLTLGAALGKKASAPQPNLPFTRERLLEDFVHLPRTTTLRSSHLPPPPRATLPSRRRPQKECQRSTVTSAPLQ